MECYGIYYIDATDLDGWTDETLVDALREPLSKIGVDVEIGQHNSGVVLFYNVGYDKIDTLREQIAAIVEKVVTQ